MSPFLRIAYKLSSLVSCRSYSLFNQFGESSALLDIYAQKWSSSKRDYTCTVDLNIQKAFLNISNIYIIIASMDPSGVARGCGWQQLGVYINLGAFYMIGLPVGAVLGFVAHLRGKGLWIGIVVGSIVQSTLLYLATSFTNWKKQVLNY